MSAARGIGIAAALTRSWLDLWPAAVLSLWAGGAATGFLRISIGRIQLSRFTRGATRSHTRRLSEYAASLSHCVGVSRQVRVLESAACSVPFTWGVFRPFIVLPSSMRGWAEGQRSGCASARASPHQARGLPHAGDRICHLLSVLVPSLHLDCIHTPLSRTREVMRLCRDRGWRGQVYICHVCP